MDDRQMRHDESSPERKDTPVPAVEFVYREMEKGEFFTTGTKDHNHILFILGGDIYISCNEFTRRIIRRNEFVFVPIAADVIGVATSACRVMFFSFHTCHDFFPSAYLKSLINSAASGKHTFPALRINKPLDTFFDTLIHYLERGINSPVLHEIKHKEFFTILQSFYKPKKVAEFLHPIIGKSPEFRGKILSIYRKVETIDDFATLMNSNPKLFSREFRDEFGLSPYQWLLNQKAKHVHFSLAESDKDLSVIRQEHGFKFSGHFTRFCKNQFNCTPLQLRKKLQRQEAVL
jgi:AraC-like DNA-binding protein